MADASGKSPEQLRYENLQALAAADPSFKGTISYQQTTSSLEASGKVTPVGGSSSVTTAPAPTQISGGTTVSTPPSPALVALKISEWPSATPWAIPANPADYMTMAYQTPAPQMTSGTHFYFPAKQSLGTPTMVPPKTPNLFGSSNITGKRTYFTGFGKSATSTPAPRTFEEVLSGSSHITSQGIASAGSAGPVVPSSTPTPPIFIKTVSETPGAAPGPGGIIDYTKAAGTVTTYTNEDFAKAALSRGVQEGVIISDSGGFRWSDTGVGDTKAMYVDQMKKYGYEPVSTGGGYFKLTSTAAAPETVAPSLGPTGKAWFQGGGSFFKPIGTTPTITTPVSTSTTKWFEGGGKFFSPVGGTRTSELPGQSRTDAIKLTPLTFEQLAASKVGGQSKVEKGDILPPSKFFSMYSTIGEGMEKTGIPIVSIPGTIIHTIGDVGQEKLGKYSSREIMGGKVETDFWKGFYDTKVISTVGLTRAQQAQYLSEASKTVPVVGPVFNFPVTRAAFDVFGMAAEGTEDMVKNVATAHLFPGYVAKEATAKVIDWAVGGSQTAKDQAKYAGETVKVFSQKEGSPTISTPLGTYSWDAPVVQGVTNALVFLGIEGLAAPWAAKGVEKFAPSAVKYALSTPAGKYAVGSATMFGMGSGMSAAGDVASGKPIDVNKAVKSGLSMWVMKDVFGAVTEVAGGSKVDFAYRYEPGTKIFEGEVGGKGGTEGTWFGGQETVKANLETPAYRVGAEVGTKGGLVGGTFKWGEGRYMASGTTSAPNLEKYYETLGVKKGASSKELQAAFRKEALKSHPDKPGVTSDVRFKDVGEAYSVLSGKSTAPAAAIKIPEMKSKSSYIDLAKIRTGEFSGGDVWFKVSTPKVPSVDILSGFKPTGGKAIETTSKVSSADWQKFQDNIFKAKDPTLVEFGAMVSRPSGGALSQSMRGETTPPSWFGMVPGKTTVSPYDVFSFRGIGQKGLTDFTSEAVFPGQKAITEIPGRKPVVQTELSISSSSQIMKPSATEVKYAVQPKYMQESLRSEYPTGTLRDLPKGFSAKDIVALAPGEVYIGKSGIAYGITPLPSAKPEPSAKQMKLSDFTKSERSLGIGEKPQLPVTKKTGTLADWMNLGDYGKGTRDITDITGGRDITSTKGVRDLTIRPDYNVKEWLGGGKPEPKSKVGFDITPIDIIPVPKVIPEPPGTGITIVDPSKWMEKGGPGVRDPEPYKGGDIIEKVTEDSIFRQGETPKVTEPGTGGFLPLEFPLGAAGLFGLVAGAQGGGQGSGGHTATSHKAAIGGSVSDLLSISFGAEKIGGFFDYKPIPASQVVGRGVSAKPEFSVKYTKVPAIRIGGNKGKPQRKSTQKEIEELKNERARIRASTATYRAREEQRGKTQRAAARNW